MSVVLYVLGVLSVIAGTGAVLLGLPVKEFSFGNTLILAGTTGVVGGLIVIGLGAAVSQLQRVVEMLGARPLSRSGQSFEGMRLGNGPGRVPFPPKPKSNARERPGEMPVMPLPIGESEPEFAAPSLRNPDVPLMAEEEAEELPLSPRDDGAARGEKYSPMPEPTDEPPGQASFEPDWRSPPPPRSSQPTSFDKMWPATERSPPPETDEPPPSRAETIPRASVEPAETPPAEESYSEPRDEREQPVAVLKSGMVDGMGYTLYVDGSIEAELPDGILRFASINELRMHLERNA